MFVGEFTPGTVHSHSMLYICNEVKTGKTPVLNETDFDT